MSAAAAEPARPKGLPDDYGGFVYAEDGKLKLNGGDFYFSGANSYAMLYSPDEAEATMQVAKSLGLNAIRFWGFWDGEQWVVDDEGEASIPPRGTDRWGRPVLQSQPREYNELALRNFDHVIYLAHVYGLKLVIPLLNEWDEFGGLKQYLEWDGYEWPDFVPSCGLEGNQPCYSAIENTVKAERYRFFDPDNQADACTTCWDVYFDWVHTVLNRENTLTGIKYKDDPAIMVWEVMNEPRIGPWGYKSPDTGKPGEKVMRDFLQKGAAFIKSIDQNHLVSTGEEGFFFEGEYEKYMGLTGGAEGAGGEGGGASTPAKGNKTGYGWDTAPGEGASYTLNLGLPEIDLGSYHAWPFNWNKAHEQWGEQYAGRIDEFMVEWVESHAAASRAIGKPSYLGEFGWQILRTEGSDVPDRDEIFKATYDAVLRTDTSGVMFWNITAVMNPDEAVWKGPFIGRGPDETPTLLDRASWDDEPTPHDMDFRFDVYCPADVTTCKLIKDATAQLTARIENPDPPFSSICSEPRTVCGEQCVLLDSSPEHCGACNNACPAEESCEAGVCTARDLGASWAKNESPYETEGGCSVAQQKPGFSNGSVAIAWLSLLAACAGLVRARGRRVA